MNQRGQFYPAAENNCESPNLNSVVYYQCINIERHRKRVSSPQLPQPCCSSSQSRQWLPLAGFRGAVCLSPQGCPGWDGLRQARLWWYLASGHRNTWLSLIAKLLSLAEISMRPFWVFVSLFCCPGNRSRGDHQSSSLLLSAAVAQLKGGWFPCVSQKTCLPGGFCSRISLLFLKLQMCFPYPKPFRACCRTLGIFATEMLPTLLKSSSKSRGWYDLHDFRVAKSWWDPFSQPLSSCL